MTSNPMTSNPNTTTEGGWMPIESAPRDGSKFDVWIPSFAEPGKGYRVADLQMCPNGRLYRYSRTNLANLARWPTHWRTIPAGPVA